MIAHNTSTDDVWLVRSLDNGSSWTEVSIDASTFNSIPTLSVGSSQVRGMIQCTADGQSLRAILIMGANNNTTLVYESTNQGTSWTEILTPRRTLATANATSTAFISRDLQTVGIWGVASANQIWLAASGATSFTDTESTLPLAYSASERTVVSADGSRILLQRHNQSALDKTFYISDDDAATWSAVSVLFNPSSDMRQIRVFATMFHPTDNDIVYVVGNGSTTGNLEMLQTIDIFTVSLVTGKATSLYSMNYSGTPEEALGSGFGFQQSTVVASSNGIVLGYSDGNNKDHVGMVKIDNDKFLADTTQDTIKYKIVADAP